MIIKDDILLSGHYRLEVKNQKGELKRELEFDNLILNSGLNRIATGSAFNGCSIGTGSITPAITQTTLAAYTNYTSNITTSSEGLQVSFLPFYGFSRKTYRFSAGSLNGNYSELGIGWAANQLFSRALIKDGNGNPTTITVFPDEILDVIYEVRLYIPTTDVVTTGSLTGFSGSIQITRRPIFTTQVGSNTTSGNKGWTPLDSSNTVGGSAGALRDNSALYPTSFTQLLPMTTPSSSVSAFVTGTLTTAAYVNNSLERNFTLNFNTSQGIGTYQHFIMEIGMCGAYQYLFSVPIVKTSDQVLELQFKSSWGRY